MIVLKPGLSSIELQDFPDRVTQVKLSNDIIAATGGGIQSNRWMPYSQPIPTFNPSHLQTIDGRRQQPSGN